MAARKTTDAANGRKAAGTKQTAQDKRDEHLAMARHHAEKAAEHAKKAGGR